MEEFQKYFFRPLVTIIFRPEMLKFHPYTILTGERIVGFVIYCALQALEILKFKEERRNFLNKCEFKIALIPFGDVW